MVVPMPSLTLKNLPHDLLEALREVAERERRSMSQEIIHLLEAALGRRPKSPTPPAAEAQVDAWRKLAGKWESQVNDEIEVGRVSERRTPGREVDL
jgi:plasmid stability protein